MFTLIFRIFGFIKNFPVIFTIGTILAGLASVAYVGWKHQIEQAALLEYNQRQLEQVIQDQKVFQEKMATVQQSQQAVIDEANRQNQELTDKLRSIDEYLNSADAKKVDRPSSIILKNTINQIGAGK